jgi:hypothetical protein
MQTPQHVGLDTPYPPANTNSLNTMNLESGNHGINPAVLAGKVDSPDKLDSW